MENIISQLKPKLIITNKNICCDYKIPIIFIENTKNFTINYQLLKKKQLEQIDTNLIYVFFTSGSTGKPKGVCISHKGVIDYTFALCDALGIKSDFILANQTPFSFDASIKDIFPIIATGGTLHIIPNHLYAFPNKIIEYIKIAKINTINWVPTVLAYFANFKDFHKLKLNELKRIYWSGEIMPTKILNKWRKQFPNIQFVNLYGPTEITGTCSYYIIERDIDDNEIIPIGKAYNNTELLVLNKNKNLITNKDINKKGNLYVRGTCVSYGYYGDIKKTNKVFIQNPLHKNYKELIYNTGDVVAYNKYGELVCYGRVDNQIKYKGHRIELGEIEHIINSHQLVKNIVCIFKEEIICFYESEQVIDFKDYLENKLPRYMIPTKFIKLNKFKLNQNGKIDRKYLKNNY